jgi:hypothetical protein
MRASTVMLVSVMAAIGLSCTSDTPTLPNEPWPVATLSIEPKSAVVSPGATLQLSAIPRDPTGASFVGIPISWASSRGQIATVGVGGIVNGVSAGSTEIIATAEGKSDTAVITVTSPSDSIHWLWETGLEVDNPFNTSYTQPGGSVTRTTECPHSGAYSLKFITPAQTYQRASVVESFPFSAKIHSVDLWFFLPIGQGDLGFEVAIEGWSGAEQHLSSFQWKKDATYGLLGWQRWAGGTWVFVPGGSGIPLAEGTWHHLLLEVDYTQRSYRKLAIDEREFNLQGLSYDVTAQVASPTLNVSILLWTSSEQSVYACIDDVRVGEVLP